MADARTPCPWWKHQLDWIADKSRFRISIKSRQIGWTQLMSFEASFYAATEGTTWILASRSQRQSNEIKRRAREWLSLMTHPVTDLQVVKDNTLDGIVLSNGGRILAVPSSPDTVAGFTGNVMLDEFARHKDDTRIWEALFPSISSQPTMRLSVVSTPLGMSGMFYELVEAARNDRGDFPWSLHEVDVYQAIANGCQHNIDELRAACFDEEVFRQSYLCEFVDEAYALLPYKMLLACVDPDLEVEPAWDDLWQMGDLYVGMDIGRTQDLTVFAILLKLGVQHRLVGMVELKNSPYDEQERVLDRLLKLRNVRRACIDSTQMGSQFAERAVSRHGHRVEAVNFSPAVKEHLAGLTRRVFEQRHIAIPDSDLLIDDLHSMQRTVTPAGNVRYAAGRQKGSHADRYTAVSLALHAAEQPAVAVERLAVPRPRRSKSIQGIW